MCTDGCTNELADVYEDVHGCVYGYGCEEGFASMGRGMGRATEMKMGTQYEYGDGGGHWDVGNEDSTEDGVGGGVGGDKYIWRGGW